MPTPKPISKTRVLKKQLFYYTTIDKTGHRSTGEVEASSLPMARAILQNQGFTVLKIKKKTLFSFSLRSRKSVKAEHITLFTRQIATLTAAGIPLVQSLAMVDEGMPQAFSELIKKVRVDIEAGSTLSNALKKHSESFDELYCSLIEAGEQSGTLDTMLDRIAVYREKTDSIRRKVKKALYYPIAVILIAFIVTAVLLVKVVPTFQEMFASSGAELPAFTEFVLHISMALQAYGIYIVMGLIALLYGLTHFYRKSIPFRQWMERISLKIPIFGSILQKSAIARFARTLTTTTAAGVPLTEALETVARAAGNSVYAKAIQHIKEDLTAGQHMRTALKKTAVFPPMVVQMVGVGEESGALEAMLSKVANLYEEEVDTSVDGLTSLLEPLIIVILGVIVGGLVVAMYLPVFKMGAIL